MPKILNYTHLALELVAAEIEILTLRITYPNSFTTSTLNLNANKTSKPTIARWRGTTAELLEYIIPLQIDGKLAKPSGKPMAFIDVVTMLEQVFGIEIKAPYDRKSKLLTRKKSGTPFTDRMRQVLSDAQRKLDQ